MFDIVQISRLVCRVKAYYVATYEVLPKGVGQHILFLTVTYVLLPVPRNALQSEGT